MIYHNIFNRELETIAYENTVLSELNESKCSTNCKFQSSKFYPKNVEILIILL